MGMTTLDTVKLLLGVTDDTKDALLTVYVDAAEAYALAYCNLVVLPDEMASVLIQLVVLAYREAQPFDENTGAQITQITEDGRTVAFGRPSSERAAALIAGRAQATGILRRFRQLYRR